MKTLSLLVGSFMFTFCVLSLGWLTFVGVGPGRFSGDPSFAPAPSLTARPTANARTPGPTSSAQPTMKPGKPTPGAVATPTESPTSAASVGPTTTETYVLVGGAYTATEVPDGGSITPSGDGVALETSTEESDALRVTYSLDATELPAGAHVVRVAARVCGQATGSTYEIDGPIGVSQSIRVSSPPEGDGCWHLDAEAPTDLSVVVSAASGTRLLIRSVEYEVTIAR